MQIITSREKFNIRKQVKYYVKTGRLEKLPCDVCGAGTVEAHHPDYNEPLTVLWLCADHHRQLHKHYKSISWRWG